MLNPRHFVQIVALMCFSAGLAMAWAEDVIDYERARWHPSHFQPQIQHATNEECLACHREVLEYKPLAQSPAGVKSEDSLAWYQTLTTYQGEQESFHRRHLVTPLARNLMDMKCNTCHQGHDPREEAPIPPGSANDAFALRKQVNPNTCLMCHGKFAYEVMGLPSDWYSSGSTFGDNCLVCHAAIRTTRHQVNFLKADAIEEAGSKNGDVCFGCHGGRAWYRNAFPYPRHSWPGMVEQTPEWAKQRPTESEARFQDR